MNYSAIDAMMIDLVLWIFLFYYNIIIWINCYNNIIIFLLFFVIERRLIEFLILIIQQSMYRWSICFNSRRKSFDWFVVNLKEEKNNWRFRLLISTAFGLKGTLIDIRMWWLVEEFIRLVYLLVDKSIALLILMNDLSVFRLMDS